MKVIRLALQLSARALLLGASDPGGSSRLPASHDPGSAGSRAARPSYMQYLLGAFAGIAMTAGTAGACGHSGATDYCGPELIAMIYVTSSGNVYLQPSSSWGGVVCTPVSGTYAVLLASAANFKQLYALLLSAKVSNNQVQMVMDPAQSTCTITYVTLQ